MFLRISCKHYFKMLDDYLITTRKLFSFDKLHKQYLSSSLQFYSEDVQRFSTSSWHENVHTTKGWKTMAKMGQRKAELPRSNDHPLSCEEGSDAVPHSVLVNEMLKCKTVSEQIETFSSVISLTLEDIEKRKEFCHSLELAFKPYFSKFRVHLFGSTINGLGFKGSDVDISFQTTFDNQEYLTDVKEVPTIQSVIDGSIPKETINRLPPRLLLRFVRRILRHDCKDVKEPILLIKARCPILRFYNAKFDLFCDFSCENEASLRNTKLIRVLCSMDKRFAVLGQFLRYWGKRGGFVGDIDQFNSYAFSLLVVHFLQQTNPPVIPPLKDIIEASEYLMKSDIYDDEQMLDDLKKFPPSLNNKPAEELLRDFFFYYLNFDFSRIMVPFTSTLVDKRHFSPSTTSSSDQFVFSSVTVQDPFRINFNTTAGATFKYCRKFLNSVMEACKTYQNPALWDPNPDTWGLPLLLMGPMSEEAIFKEWQATRTFTINLPLKSKSNVIRRVLEECLLFECKECYDEEASLKLSCRVYNNTWQGRDWIQTKCPESISDRFKIENWISNQVLKSRDEYSKQPMFSFTCKCYENTLENRLDVNFSFPETKCNPVIAVFLKDYIPSLYKKLVQ